MEPAGRVKSKTRKIMAPPAWIFAHKGTSPAIRRSRTRIDSFSGWRRRGRAIIVKNRLKSVWAEPDPVTKKDKEQNGQEEWRPGVGEESSPVDSTDRRAHHQQQPSCNTHG